MRTLRGRGHAFPFPEDGAATLSSEQDHSMNGTGFRLVHDSVDRVERGGSCLLDSFNVGQARGYRVNPAFPSAARGFRLVRGET